MTNRIGQLSKRERTLRWAALIAVISGGAYVYAVEPFVAEWTALRTQANELAAEHANLKDLLTKRAEIERRYDDIRGAVTEVEAREDKKLTLWKQVDVAASRSGLSVTSIKPLGIEKERGFERVSVRLGAQSEAHQFVGFLQALQRSDQFLRCENFTVTVGRSRPPLTISFTLSKLMKNENDTPGSRTRSNTSER